MAIISTILLERLWRRGGIRFSKQYNRPGSLNWGSRLEREVAMVVLEKDLGRHGRWGWFMVPRNSKYDNIYLGSYHSLKIALIIGVINSCNSTFARPYVPRKTSYTTPYH